MFYLKRPLKGYNVNMNVNLTYKNLTQMNYSEMIQVLVAGS